MESMSDNDDDENAKLINKNKEQKGAIPAA